MKIDYVDDVTLIMDTARSIQVTKTCNALAAIGAEVKLVGLRGRGSLSEVRQFYGIKSTFPIKRYSGVRGRYVSSAWFRLVFGVHIGVSQADVIYTRDLGVAVLAQLLGRPFVYEMHSMPVRKQQVWMLRKISSASHLVAVIPITYAIASELNRNYQIDPAKVHVIPCGADAPNVVVPVRPPSERSQFKVGYVGHLYPGKGGAMIAKLAQSRPNYEFHLVGELRDSSAMAQMPANVITYGTVSHRKAMSLLSEFDCVIAPYSSRTEATDGKVISDWFSPLKVFEYMAYGRPIVCSDLPVIREILVSGYNSQLVNPDDVNAWLAGLDSIERDYELAKRLGANASEDLQMKYSYVRRAEKIVSILSRSQVQQS